MMAVYVSESTNKMLKTKRSNYFQAEFFKIQLLNEC